MTYCPVYTNRCLGVPLSDEEWIQLTIFLKNSGQKKGFFVRNLIIDRMKRDGILKSSDAEKIEA